MNRPNKVDVDADAGTDSLMSYFLDDIDKSIKDAANEPKQPDNTDQDKEWD